MHGAADLIHVQAQLEGQFAGLERLQAEGRFAHQQYDVLGIFLKQILDIDAAMFRAADIDALGLAVQHEREIKLPFELFFLLHVNPLDQLAVRSGLRRHQTLAQQIGGILAHVVIGAAHLDAPGLAAASGMDLGLDHPTGPAQFGGGIDGLLGRMGDGTARHGHTEFRKHFLRLILMNVHQVLRFCTSPFPDLR